MVGRGQVTRGELVVLADIENPGGADPVGRYQRYRACGLTGGGPGRNAVIQFAGDQVVADFAGLPDDLGGILVGVAHDHQRLVCW